MGDLNRDSIEELIKNRVAELKKSPSFDPRKEKELNEIYDQYVPPHSIKDTSHLLDVAERDAYIDPFPPLGSHKKGGVVIKKGIRSAIGWYIQYISQQISTFGSGVAQALRAINKDIDELKKHQSNEQVSHLLSGLDLANLSNEVINGVNSLTSVNGKVLVSDSVNYELIDEISGNLIVVDNNLDRINKLPGNINSRVSDLYQYLIDVESSSIEVVLLHGTIDFLSVSSKVGIIENISRVLGSNGTLILSTRQNGSELNGDEAIACQLLGQSLWSNETWTHVLKAKFAHVKTKTIGSSIVFTATNSDK